MFKLCIVILYLTICTKADTDSNYTSCRTIEGSLCVPYYLCDGYIVEESGFIDIWTEPECDEYFEVCCKPEKIKVVNQL